MIETLQSWVVAMTAAALLAAGVEALLPGTGAIKRIVRLVCGLVFILAITKPLLDLDPGALSYNLSAYRIQAGEYGSALEETGDRLVKSIIEADCAAYIEKKADALGLDCVVEVRCEVGEEHPYPVAAAVSGSLTQMQQKQLSDWIVQEFAIPAKQISFHTKDVSG